VPEANELIDDNDAFTLKTLDQIVAADRSTIGGKAYNCAHLRQAGLPVPDALVVPIDVSDDALVGIDRDPWFATLPSDELFAVRSSGIDEDSAAHSFAGIHETRLNVTRRDLVHAIRECRTSTRSAQAIAYRANRDVGDDEARIGVLVQRMPQLVSGKRSSAVKWIPMSSRCEKAMPPSSRLAAPERREMPCLPASSPNSVAS
jgi:pyruvate,water dikinase